MRLSGAAVQTSLFISQANCSGLWTGLRTFHRSAPAKARNKLPWQVFEDVIYAAVHLARTVIPRSAGTTWNGKRVLACDGSKMDLPASRPIQAVFDPASGPGTPGHGHYPQCLVTTVYDVFARIPVARQAAALRDTDERGQFKKLLPRLPPHQVLLFDRGYPSLALIYLLLNHYRGEFVFRCPAKNPFAAVARFIHSGKQEDSIRIYPSGKFLTENKSPLQPVRLRVIRLESPSGEVSVLPADIGGRKKQRASDLIGLYFRRGRVEEHYKTGKDTLKIENFHSKSVNCVLQELYAVLIAIIISRILMVLADKPDGPLHDEPQLKHAMAAMARDAALLAPENPVQAVAVFTQLLELIRRVQYQRPAKPGMPQPRINKQPPGKWILHRNKAKNISKA